MNVIAKLIHKTSASYLPTAFPAHYYGMPNGKIYLVFSRFYEIEYGRSGLEFVFAEHKDFKYDYETETIISVNNRLNQPVIFAENVDHPKPSFRILNTNRQIQSYGEAHVFLNKKAKKMRRYA